ncbi:MAG TPA: lysophospholipid acyltransferase family protein [Myxococcales bacterium]|nr:lysophospholipid acyltransferase family protein [Myxococcales bacterium]
MSVPWPKRLRRELRVRALLLLLTLLKALPYGFAGDLCAFLGALGYYVSAKQRRLALESLAVAFPELSAGERAVIARQSFAHLGRNLAESTQASRLDIVDEVELDPSSEARLRAAQAKGKGVIVVTGHLGNWEFLARRVAALGLPTGTVAKQAQDPRLTALLTAGREGLTIFWREQQSSGRELVRFLKGGGMVGILIDQDTKVAGHFVPFFGREAFTPRAAADFAVRLDAALLFGACYRVSPRKHRIEIRSIDVPLSGDREADSVALTAAATCEIEAEIREHPAQWVWMHPRWNTKRGVIAKEK